MWCKVLLLILMTNLAQNDQPNAFDFLGKAAPRYIQEEQWWLRKSGWKCEICNQEIILKESIEVVLSNDWDIRSRHQPLLRWQSKHHHASSSSWLSLSSSWSSWTPWSNVPGVDGVGAVPGVGGERYTLSTSYNTSFQCAANILFPACNLLVNWRTGKSGDDMQGMFALCAFTFYRENSAWFKKLKWTTGDTPEYGRLFEQTSWITIHTKKCHAIIQCVYAFSVIYRSSISLRLTITDIYVIHVITECMKI